ARSLDKLYNFADCSGLHLIFALNALRRNPNNSWNSSSALSLLKYSASKKYNISWELGNEPNNYRTMHGRAVNGSQLGKDYIQLKSLLQPIRIYSRASLYGPNIGRPRKNVIALLDGFMKVAGSTVDAVTWQHCYIDGRVVKVMDFLKTRLLDTLSDQIRKIQKVVNTYTPGKKIWLEGVVTTSAGGTNNLSDSYAAGFLWLNTLGMLANQGIDVVIRHSFFDHGYNHLVDQNFNPLPSRKTVLIRNITWVILLTDVLVMVKGQSPLINSQNNRAGIPLHNDPVLPRVTEGLIAQPVGEGDMYRQPLNLSLCSGPVLLPQNYCCPGLHSKQTQLEPVSVPAICFPLPVSTLAFFSSPQP
uniref:Heparanase 2 (inactive) n=1 Tax=Sus scrofa TaxID=9823 RepID=A0A8D1WNQ7_PIG